MTSHQGTRNWVTHIYISNGDGVLEDRLVLRFIAIPAFLKIIPLCDTCYKVCSFESIMVNNCVVQGCVVGTAKQNVTLREFPKASRQDASYGGVSYRRLEATG